MDPNFGASRGYSLEHAQYEPSTEVRHCQNEFNYTYHINTKGLRQQNLYREHPKILAIGDSFTFGFGVSDTQTFPALLGAYNVGMWGNPFYRYSYI